MAYGVSKGLMARGQARGWGRGVKRSGGSVNGFAGCSQGRGMGRGGCFNLLKGVAIFPCVVRICFN